MPRDVRPPVTRTDLKAPKKFDDGLDQSRKQALWLRANWAGTIVMVAILGLSILNMVSDVRGEYAGSNDALGGMLICSVTHSDKNIEARLTIPNTPLLICNTTEENVGPNVDWLYKVVHKTQETTPVHFVGNVDSGAMTGIIQDGVKVFPVKLQKDMLASVLRQLRAFIPGAN